MLPCDYNDHTTSDPLQTSIERFEKVLSEGERQLDYLLDTIWSFLEYLKEYGSVTPRKV